MSRICLQDVSKQYGQVEAVANLNLTIESGQFVTLLGPSGSGKTTTMRMIAGLERPSNGTISIGDRVVTDAKTFVPTYQRRLGMVFQSYAIWPHKNVWENVVFPLRQQRVPRNDRATRARAVLDRVGLAEYADRYPSQLSGGQQQRVSLARALVAEPDVILFDEPLSNLDAQLRDSMRELLSELHQSIGTTSIYVTHDQTEAMVLSDRVHIMNKGRLIQSGTPRDLYERPANRFVAGFVGSANILNILLADDDTAQLEGGVSLRVASGQARPVENILMIRPHQLCFATEREVSNVMNGCVSSVSYLGDRERYSVSTETGSSVTVEVVGGGPIVKRGENVKLHFPPHACIII